MQRWLVIYYDGNAELAKLMDVEDGTFPFGVDPSMIGDDCEIINAIIEVADTTTVPLVVMDDREVMLDEPTQP